MSIVLTRATKQAARYTDAGGRERCSGCRFFLPQGTCGRIVGPVSPRGWCRFFSQEAVQRWQPGSVLGSASARGATLDLGFTNPGQTLSPLLTFTRASIATYFDSAGTMQTTATNAPRFDYNPTTFALNGLLIEEPRTNVLLNSATLGTQSVAVTAQAYTLSFYGTGTITKSGTAAGALVGTGAFPQRVSQTFTPTAGTLTLTVTGSVLNAQLEAGAFPTSYIPTTGAAATRAIDHCGIAAGNMSFYTSPGGSWVVEFISPALGIDQRRILANPAAGQATQMYLEATNQIAAWDTVSAVATTNAITANTVQKCASTWAVGSARLCLAAGPIASAATMTAGFGNIATAGVNFFNNAAPAESLSGYLRRVQYWPRILSDAELQSVTT